LPIGAGLPDFVIATYIPDVTALARSHCGNVNSLAYLRVVRKARLDTLSARLGEPPEKLRSCLSKLVEAQILTSEKGTFSLAPAWRDVLPEVIAVEVKVEKWRRALSQAIRNLSFAHRSYVALPSAVAHRVRSEPDFRQLGIGLLAVNGKEGVKVVRTARRNRPRVWRRYYELAFELATQVEKGQ
jgi:hypothetical protein